MNNELFNNIPKDWELKKLGDIGETIIGLTYSPNDVSESGTLVLRSSNIYSNRLKYDDNVFVNKKINERIINKEGDILICVRNGSRRLIGKCALIKGRAVGETFGAFMSMYRSKHNSYIFHVLQSDFIKVQIEQHIGATINQITNNNLNNFEFPCPPLPQQQKIAQILTTCDAVIEKTEAAIAKYQAMKQGMMHDLFTRGIDVNTGKLRPKQEDEPQLYKESELGWIPNEWKVKKLEEITNYVDYRGKTPPKTDKGIFLITAKNIKQGFIDYENSKEYIPEFAYRSAMSRGIPEIGDVLITTEAPMGNVAQINFEGLALAQRVIKYRCIPSEMYNNFLKHSMMSEYFQRELEAESTGSTVKGIKGSRLHQLNVFKPELKEQEKIIQSIAPLELKLQTEQSALSKYQQLKTGLMQDLLSGKVEVKV